VIVGLSETENKDSKAKVLSTAFLKTQPAQFTKLRHPILVSCYLDLSRLKRWNTLSLFS